MGDAKRVNVEGDGLSSLPDDLIHKILSFVSIKHAVKTSVLSSRWRFIWTSMPYLSFSINDFSTLTKFSNFVKHVLLGRNNQIEVSSVELAFRGKISQALVKRILDYAFSHSVQQLNVTCLYEKKRIEIPPFLFSSQSLKHLTLTGYCDKLSIMASPTWELPALATLYLNCVTLHDDNTDGGAGLFSNCANLKNLTLKHCRLVGLKGFSMFHPGLSSLTLENGYEFVNVVTPQLKNLTIKNWRRIHLISAPNLSSLRYKDYYYGHLGNDLLQLSTDLLHLEKVDVCIEYTHPHPPSPTSTSTSTSTSSTSTSTSTSSDEEGQRSNKDESFTHKIVSLLQQLHNVKYLTLNLELVKLLSSSEELISHQPSPFTNLKSLKIYPANLYQPKVAMSFEVKNYLLDGSPGATFTMVSHEDVRAVMDVAKARNLMGELRVLLDQWKKMSETNTAPVKQYDAPMESHMTTTLEQAEVENHRVQPDTKMEWHFGEKMANIKTYWEDLNKQLEKGYKNTGPVISTLKKIEGVMTKLPTSHRAKLQARFFSLCAEAETIMDNAMDRLQIQCGKKPSRSNVYCNELAAS